jgi:hypothetical protein
MGRDDQMNNCMSLVPFRKRSLAVVPHGTLSLYARFDRLLNVMARAIRCLQLLNQAVIHCTSTSEDFSCSFLEEMSNGTKAIIEN